MGIILKLFGLASVERHFDADLSSPEGAAFLSPGERRNMPPMSFVRPYALLLKNRHAPDRLLLRRKRQPPDSPSLRNNLRAIEGGRSAGFIGGGGGVSGGLAG